jgi:hypothetical protein
VFSSGITPVTISLAALGDAAKTLRSGQVQQVLVQGNAEELWLPLGGQRIPLGKDSGFTPGQIVRAEVVPDEQGVQVRVSSAPAGTAPTAPVSGTASVLTAVLGALGALPALAYAARLLPEGMPRSDLAMRQVLQLFLRDGSVGKDLNSLVTLLSAAARQGAVSEETLQMIRSLLPEAVTKPGAMAGFLRAAAADNVEVRLRQAIESGTLRELLASLTREGFTALAALRQDTRLEAWLRGKGQWRQFEQTVDRILDHMAGTRLQNLHGLEHAYVFIEVPLPPESGLKRAQIHLMGEGGQRGKRGFEGQTTMIAMDLSTTHLGDLWVTLRTVAGQCECQFRAMRSEVVSAIEDNAGELKGALAEAGYSEARIGVSIWDGDRGRETAQLMQRFSGIDVHA